MTTASAPPPTSPTLCWAPLTALGERFRANVAALAGRDPDLARRLLAVAPASPYCIAAAGDGIRLGIGGAGGVDPLPLVLPAAQAAATLRAICPTGAYTRPILIAGEDQGWLWDGLYRLPVKGDIPNGHVPPLYFAIADLERLWVLAHVHAWHDLFGDPRVRLFAGPDAAEQVRRFMVDDAAWRWPATCVTVGASLWPAGVTLDVLQGQAQADRDTLLARLAEAYTPVDAEAALARHIGRRPLRVLGLTSRYTTFLQHSMRDWLAGFERLGHTVRLQIEGADHEIGGPLADALACHAFRPDLIVIIDHYRAECPGLPPHVPTVMWVQDRLPNIFRPAAGEAQGPLDFCMGFGRLTLGQTCGYPPERFMTCPVGTNVERFAGGPPTAGELARFGCDVSYVSHASRTAEQLIADRCRLAEADPDVARLLDRALVRMRDHYQRDPRNISEVAMRRLLRDAEADAGQALADAARTDVESFLLQDVNSALIRHQSLLWVAELGVDLRLYGRGWEQHPQLGRYARGVADNQTDLSAIYRCSTINLHVSPYGAVHQRLLDGLSAGGFFLARWNQGDSMGIPYRGIWDFCPAHGVTDDDDLHRQAPPDVAALVTRVHQLQGFDMRAEGVPLYDAVRSVADGGFSMLADGVFGDDYDRIAYRTRDEVREKVTTALADPAGRRAVADRMRAQVVDRFSYQAITARLLDMIARQLPVCSQTTLAEAA